MATVRITNDIRCYVRNKFEDLYRARINRKMEELQNLDIGNVCYQHYISAKYRELAQQLNTDPDGKWIDEISNITIEMTYRKRDINQSLTKVVFNVPFNPPVPLPQRFRWYGAKFKLLESMGPYEHAKKIYHEIDDIIEERDKLISQIVRGVLAKCSTLRQVLELWPTALEFMPDEVKQKHAAKTEKRQPVVKEVSIDDDVKVSIMKARMLNTGG